MIKLRYPADLAERIASNRRRRRIFLPLSIGMTLVSIALTFEPGADNVWILRASSFLWIVLWYVFERSLRHVEGIDLSVCNTEIEVDDDYLSQRDSRGQEIGRLRRSNLKCRSSVQAVGNAAYYLSSRDPSESSVVVFTSKIDRADWLIRDVVGWRF